MKNNDKCIGDYCDTHEYTTINILLKQELDSPSSLSPLPHTSPDSEQEDEIDIPSVDYEVRYTPLIEVDPKIANLKESAKNMYLKANHSYINTDGHKTNFIQIRSGRRNVREQAELYEKFLNSLYDGPPANKANKPGKSFHEYGLAIDVIRNGDDSRLIPALESAGWVQAVADEGWHFQAESATDWGDVVNRIEIEISPMSEKYAENRVVYYENKKKISDTEPSYMNERRRLSESELALNLEKKNINIQRDKLQKEQLRLKQADVQLKNQRLRVQQLKNQYSSLVYNRCPAGKSYNDCTHIDLKNVFDKEKNSLYNEYLSAMAELNNSEKQQASAWAKWSDDSAYYRSQLQLYQDRLQKYEQDLIKNEGVGKKIERWRQEMNARNSLKEQNLMELTSAVEKI
ncbi:TPA: D-alanyl-D-alanine carboxypeptidase family protein [Yersinia enterocolitica]|nr:D-alanyl-D-alanine carboxypeptidase family protein [Yersinia enterocolitica]HDL6898280.1 D-alanyl-D-alanine carboxypeptidase family protein [Yersinia enterocolitica]